MKRLHQLSMLLALAVLLASCKTPSYSSGHPDSPRSGPFWERNDQRDR
jgi:hypothetical protein